MGEPSNSSDSSARFSDEKLFQLHKEFKLHVVTCEAQFAKGAEQFQQLIAAQHQNTAAIAALVEETRVVVQLHRDWQGASRVGQGVQNFSLWLLKWGAIGTSAAILVNWGSSQLAKLFN